MDIELNLTDFKNICHNIHFLLNNKYYIIDCEAEKKRLVNNRRNSFWNDHAEKRIYAKTKYLDFLISKFPEAKDKLLEFSKEKEYCEFIKASSKIAREVLNFSNKAKVDGFGDSSYLIKSTLEEHNQIINIANISENFVLSIVNILRDIGISQYKIGKKSIYDKDSKFNKDFLTYFYSLEEKIPHDWNPEKEIKKIEAKRIKDLKEDEMKEEIKKCKTQSMLQKLLKV